MQCTQSDTGIDGPPVDRSQVSSQPRVVGDHRTGLVINRLIGEGNLYQLYLNHIGYRPPEASVLFVISTSA